KSYISFNLTEKSELLLSKVLNYFNLILSNFSYIWIQEKYLIKAIYTIKDSLLKPDTFSEYYLLGFLLSISIFLIVFNYFYNYIAEELKYINKGERFSLNLQLSKEDTKREKLKVYTFPSLEYNSSSFFRTKILVKLIIESIYNISSKYPPSFYLLNILFI
ncbi:unnamed protein product, partial [Clonostachys rhizophaga]